MRIFDKIRGNKTVTPEERRKKNNEYIKKNGIACLESLPVIESSASVKLKSIDAVCRRAIACLLSIQLACDIEEQNDYGESRELFLNLLKKYHVEKFLLEKEKRLFENKYSSQDVIDVAWTYEAYWALIRVLGVIDDIKMPDTICDCLKAITLVGDCKDYEDFKSQCKIRDVEEILDILDLYYRYHWACVEKRVRPDTNIGLLNPDVVVERRKGLEWVMSDIEEWDEIPLDT